MCDLLGESVQQLERLGVRVRLVSGLSERALYFRKRGLALLDDGLTASDRDALLDELSRELASDLEWAEALHRQTP